MYAVVVHASVTASAAASARSSLQEQVIPMVKSAPGFIAGYWLEPQDGKGFSIVLFETEEQASQAAPPPGASPTEGATIESVEFHQVIASA